MPTATDTVCQNGDKPQAQRRGSRGQFLLGTAAGPGRPPGPNKTTITGHVLRRRIFECWDEIEGNKRLAEWAKKNFGDYLKIVAKLLPRNIEIEGGIAGGDQRVVDRPKGAADFLARALEHAGQARSVEPVAGGAQGSNGNPASGA